MSPYVIEQYMVAYEVENMCERSGFWFRQTGITPSKDELIDIDSNLCGFIEILQEWAEFKGIECIAGEDVHKSRNERVHNG